MDLTRSKARAAAPFTVAGTQGKDDIVGRSPLGSLEGESRQALLALGTLDRLPRRHTIAAQGEPPRSLLLIGSGRVKLTRVHAERAVPLGHRGPGQMVGETAVGGATLATESATVLDDVEAFAVPIDALRDRLAGDAALRAVMAGALVSHHRAAERRLEGLLLQSVEARLAAFLLDAASRWGERHPDGVALSAPFTHAEVAYLIGSTRETVTLVLGKLRREGRIAFDHRRVILRDPEELGRYLSGSAPLPSLPGASAPDP
jgi:CRP/FNR family transcriptional regulator, cyclic AMP receptor protein